MTNNHSSSSSSGPDPSGNGPANDAALWDAVLGETFEEALSPALRARSEAWKRLLAEEAAPIERTVELLGGDREARRIAHVIRRDVKQDESGASRSVRRRRRWAHVFAWSVAAHVLALGTVWWFSKDDQAPPSQDNARFSARFEPRFEYDDDSEDEWNWRNRAHLRELSRTDIEAFRRAELFQDHADGLSIQVTDDALFEVTRPALAEELNGSGTHDEALPSADDSSRAGSDSSSSLPSGMGLEFDHPLHVAPAMFVRRSIELKRRKLAMMGLDGNRTLREMNRGLSYLRNRQLEDGSFPAPKDGSMIQSTALALLPFLGDGCGSALEDAPIESRRAVARGIAWIREHVFVKHGLGKDDTTKDDTTKDDSSSRGSFELRLSASLSAAEVGCATTALAEDYMLSFGSLSVREVRARRRELRALGVTLAQFEVPAASGAIARASDPQAVWMRLGRDAYARAGFAVPAESSAVWQASADAMTNAESMDPSLRNWLRGAVLMRASAREGRDAKAHLMVRSWLAAHAPEWIGTLATARSGKGRSNGSGIEQVSLTLLALQTAYRGY